MSYDDNGNMMSRMDLPDPNAPAPSQLLGTTYEWDHESRLTSVTLPDSRAVSYAYDALGRRISRTERDTTTFTYDGLDVVLDYDTSLRATTYQYGPGIDNKLKTDHYGTSQYFLQDHLGSTVGLSDANGDISETNSYDSFGNPTNGSFSTRYQFTGREWDPFSNHQFSRARWYDPAIGRFISDDPIGLSGGINQYSYVGNNPVSATDPSGLYEIDVHYYLTKYIAQKSGCFSKEGARQIAEGNQRTDEDADKSPGKGRSFQNSTYHALHPGAAPGFGSQSLNARVSLFPNYLMGLGNSLHYLQDTFSHEGFPNPNYGHAAPGDLDHLVPGGHTVDKTASDVAKTLRMAKSTFAALDRFSREQCGCSSNPWDQSMEDIIQRFAEVGTNSPFLADIEGDTGVVGTWPGLADYAALEKKISILNVDRR